MENTEVSFRAWPEIQSQTQNNTLQSSRLSNGLLTVSQ
jgi:hypothetical protein